MPLSNQKNLKVAIITPVYNTARYLRECLDSILSQTYKNFAVFTIDDGSTDGSGQILDEYTAKDSRIITIHKKNGGVSSARNTALDAIENDGSFDYITFVDSDDVVKRNFLELYVMHLSANKADYAVCGWESFDKTGIVAPAREQESRNPELLRPAEIIDQDGAFQHTYRTGKWAKVSSNAFSDFIGNRCFSTKCAMGKRFDTSMEKGEDQEFLLQMLLYIKKGVIIDDTIFMYRIRASSLSHHNSTPLSDMDLLIELLNRAKSYPVSAQLGLQRRAFEAWWNALRFAILNDSYKDTKEKFVYNYRFLKSLEHKIELQNKRRLVLFSLGEKFLALYFSHKKKKINDDQLRALSNAYE